MFPSNSLLPLHLIALLFTSTLSAATKNSNGFATKLIHYDSIRSPFYNPRETISDRAKRAIESSMARSAYSNTKTKKQFFYVSDDIRGILFPTRSVFLVNISVGEPPFPQMVAMDTGSDLLWIQCLPCQCYDQMSGPIYDPSKSSTFAQLTCDDPECPLSSLYNCNDSTNNCQYISMYVDNTYSQGDLATEKLVFSTSDDGTISITDVIFGCGHENRHAGTMWSGILGLGYTQVSIVSQLGSKFSYCIGDIHDHRYDYNQLIIGEGARLQGYSTPIQIEYQTGIYFVTLLGIYVGNTLLDIDPTTFQRSAGVGGVLIDTGATITRLTGEVFESLITEVKNVIGGQLRMILDDIQPAMLCYYGVLSRDLKGFPPVTFRFAGGADLVLDVGSMFMAYHPDMFCMNAIESTHNQETVIGVLAQQFYNIGFDLIAKKVYFERIDCELLED